MSTGRLISERSSFISFKCCKSKQFIHFVCIKCYAIYHKCCIPKFQKSIRFIKDNQLVCCDEDESFVSDRDEVRDVLEKTIHDLTEESDLKNKYIKKIKDDREAFFQEAMKREEDMSELLKRQEQLIEELNNQITDLKKEININLNSKKMTNTIGTQTIFKIKKDASTLTDIPCRTDKKLSACKETKTLSKPDNVHKILNSNNSQIVHRERNNENTMKRISNNKNKTRKRRILLLTDDINITSQLRRHLDLNLFEMTVVRKPGACLYQVIENIESLANNFTFRDNIIVVGGTNDIVNNKTPSFRYICDKLKLCSHTNVTFVSVPYYKKYSQKIKHTYKFNTRLYQFLEKFNSCSEGNIEYVEINNQHSYKVNTRMVVSNIVDSILATNRLPKTLTFIHTSDVVNNPPNDALVQESQNMVPASVSSNAHESGNTGPALITLNDTNDSMILSHNDSIDSQAMSSSNFLYPRLSQMFQE